MLEKKSLKILIIVENLPVPLDRRVWQEANSLKKEGYEVSIICPKGKGFYKKLEIIDGIHIFRHPLPLEARTAKGYFVEYFFALFWEFVLSAKVFLKRGFDVIHACNPPDLIFVVGLFYKALFGKKFVFDHHDIFPEMWIAKGGKKNFVYKFLLILEKVTFKLSDISIATSRSYQELALKRGGQRKEDVFLVRSSPSEEIYDRDLSESSNTRSKLDKKHIIGYVGVMAVQDGVDYLLRAADYIVNKKGRSEVLFLLIGQGPEWNYLKKYVKELNLNNNIFFTGWKSGDELVNLLNSCDIGVCPEPDNEYNNKSSLNKVLEYMMLGKPIVQFDLEEGRYLAQGSSLYAKANDEVDFANKILVLLDNENLRKKMGEIGRKRVKEKFSWENAEKELNKAYKSLFIKKRYKE
ncbi:MAG: glycosyltransferase family 4 protein [Elusimicrobiota bacterium]